MLTFEKEFSRRGYPVLSIELRGRGASMQGMSYDSPEVFDVRENLLDSPYELDTMAAIEFLATQRGIDPEKIALVGEARGSRSTLIAAASDERVKSLILISAYDPDDTMIQAAKMLKIPVMLIDTETNWATPGTLQIHELLERGQLMIYPPARSFTSYSLFSSRDASVYGRLSRKNVATWRTSLPIRRETISIVLIMKKPSRTL